MCATKRYLFCRFCRPVAQWECSIGLTHQNRPRPFKDVLLIYSLEQNMVYSAFAVIARHSAHFSHLLHGVYNISGWLSIICAKNVRPQLASQPCPFNSLCNQAFMYIPSYSIYILQLNLAY